MYARFKHNFDFEASHDKIQEKKYKVAFTKFQLSSHDLAIERGRHDYTGRNDRICKHSNIIPTSLISYILIGCL